MEFNIFWDLPAYLLVILLAFILIITIDKIKSKKRFYPTKKSGIVVFAKDLIWVVLIVFILRAFMVEPFRIPSGSMLPNLLIGDFVLVNKSSYGVNLPLFNIPVIKYDEVKRGDVVVFRYPNDPAIPFIKRVIGTPGDKIVYKNKTLTINDEIIISFKQNSYDGVNDLYDEYLNQNGIPIKILKNEFKDENMNPNSARLEDGFEVPEGFYFVMGDNRDNSNDSRYWGFVPYHHILGKALLVWANITTDGTLLTTNLDEIKQFFTTFNLNFNSAGMLNTGRTEDKESEEN